MLSDAKEKHIELGKGPKSKVGQDQFDRACRLLIEITGHKRIEDLSRAVSN